MTQPLSRNYDTDKSARFLKRRVPYPVLTAVRVDRATGQRGAVETKSWPSFHTDSKEEADCWAWIEARQGKANIYYSVNEVINATATKASRENIARMVSFHVDLDPRVSEDQDDAVKRLTELLKAYDKPPTWIIPSGGGVQGIWDLKPGEYLEIGGDLAIAEDVKLYNIQLERDLGGDSCHNIDRIMRLPGTENCPDAKKRTKTPPRRYAPAYVLEYSDRLYSPSEFMKAAKVAETTQSTPAAAPRTAVKVDIPTNISRIISLDDVPELEKLKPWVKRVIHEGSDPMGEKSWQSRSEMVFAVACEFARNDVPDGIAVSIFTDPDFKISKSILEKKNVQREVTRVISRAHEFALDPDLAEANAKHAVVELGGKVLVLTWKRSETDSAVLVPVYMGFEHFRNKYFNRVKEVDAIDAKGQLYNKKVKFANWWLGHPNHTQYEGVRYIPYDDRDVVDGNLNLWNGFAVPAIMGDKHLSLLEHAKRNLCRNDEEHFRYLIGWCAHAVQRRNQKSGVALVLRSEAEGTGKGTFITTIGKLYGKHYRHVTQPDHLVGKFNAHLQSCSFVFADEAFFAGDRKHEGVLKTIITEDEILVEPKGVDIMSVPNFMNVAIASNSRFVIPAGPTSRRFFVLDVAEDNLQDTPFFAKIREDLADGGRSHLLHYLLNYDLTGFDVRKFPVTDALREQRAMTRKGLDAVVEQIAHSGVLPCGHHRYPERAITTGVRLRETFWTWCKDSVPDLKHWTAEAMFSVMKSAWDCERKTSNGAGYISFPPLAKLRKAFDARHGKQDWSDGPTTWQAATVLVEVDPASAKPRKAVNQEDIPF